MFVTDFLMANNDRAGNFRFGKSNQIFAIDNDSGLLLAERKKFCKDLVFAMSRVPQKFLCAIDRFIEAHPNDLGVTLFSEYPKALRKKFTKEFLERRDILKSLRDKPDLLAY